MGSAKIVIVLFLITLIGLLNPVFGQSLSELDKQLTEQNLERVKETGEGGSQEESSFVKVDCPFGQIEKAVSGGGIICVDDPNFQGVTSLDDSWYIIVGIIISVIIIAAVAKAKQTSSIGERRSFLSSVKEEVLKKQSHRCNDCNRVLDVVDFDHIDGDRSNNDISNCQALCPTCHAKKSRRVQMGTD